MNWKKLRCSTRATLTNPNFQSFCQLGKSLKCSLRPAFKNPNFESKYELKNTMCQFKLRKMYLLKTEQNPGFCDFFVNIIISHIFLESFSEIPQVVQKI